MRQDSTLPSFSIGVDRALCLEESLLLDATTPNATYLWQDNSIGSTFNITLQGTYWTMVTVNNCNQFDSIVITNEDCQTNFKTPNIFTPNNDGINDEFRVSINDASTFSCKIYNRWGVLLRELTEINEWWDGRTHSGLQCTSGVYYWIVEYQNITGKELMEKGLIQLIK